MIGLINSKEESFVDKYWKNEFPDLFYDCKLFSKFLFEQYDVNCKQFDKQFEKQFLIGK